MLNDLIVSETTNSDFRMEENSKAKNIADKERSECDYEVSDFHALLLTQSFWPNLSSMTFSFTPILPPKMGKISLYFFC
jgi:hypothetical protein